MQSLVSFGVQYRMRSFIGSIFVVLCLSLLSVAQANCPVADRLALAPTALVSSPRIKVRLHPPLSKNILGVPDHVEVVVSGSLRPVRVELNQESHNCGTCLLASTQEHQLF
jgi:hypothetical protein